MKKHKKIAVMKMKIVVIWMETAAMEIVNVGVVMVKNAIVMKIATVSKTMEIMAAVMKMEIVDVLKTANAIVTKIAIVVIWMEIAATKEKMETVVMKEKMRIVAMIQGTKNRKDEIDIVIYLFKFVF